VLPKSTKTLMFLEVCTTFIPDSFSKQSNMAIMEVSFPSGYTYDPSTTPELRGVAKVKVSRRGLTMERH
jgi:CD109 antigen